MPIPTVKFVELLCLLPLEGMLSSLCYNLILVIICTFYAFKTRKLPDNYNESRYIAFCVDTTLIIWISFVPTYFTASRAYFKVIILSVALILNATVNLLCLFVPKLYALYHQLMSKDEGNTKEDGFSNFRSNLGSMPNGIISDENCDFQLVKSQSFEDLSFSDTNKHQILTPCDVVNATDKK